MTHNYVVLIETSHFNPLKSLVACGLNSETWYHRRPAGEFQVTRKIFTLLWTHLDRIKTQKTSVFVNTHTIQFPSNLKWIFHLRKSTMCCSKKHKQFICQDFNRASAFTRVLRSLPVTHMVCYSPVYVCILIIVCLI